MSDTGPSGRAVRRSSHIRPEHVGVLDTLHEVPGGAIITKLSHHRSPAGTPSPVPRLRHTNGIGEGDRLSQSGWSAFLIRTRSPIRARIDEGESARSEGQPEPSPSPQIARDRCNGAATDAPYRDPMEGVPPTATR